MPRPSLARAGVASLALALVLASGAGAGSTPTERALLRELNDARLAHGLTALRAERAMDAGARRYARTLVRTDRFAHARLRPGLREVLAWGSRGVGPAALVRMWLASPPHRAAILWRGARKIGVGAARGEFQGHAGATVAVARLGP